MKKVYRNTFFFILLFIFFLNNSFSQNYLLNVTAKNTLETEILSVFHFTKEHQTKKSAFSQIDSISNELTRVGYLNNSYKTTINNNLIECKFDLGVKIDSVLVSFEKNILKEALLKEISNSYSTEYFKIDFMELENVLKSIVSHFVKKGYPFTTVQLQNTTQINNELKTQLIISKSYKRRIDKIIIKGYDNFPKNFKKHYFQINQYKAFNTNTVSGIQTQIQHLPFIQQIKEPEVLFSKDSTLLYIYIKKRAQSNFDGIIGFSNEEGGKLKFNGYLNLHLSNIFDKGETIDLEWKNSKDLNNQLKIKTATPYIFNSKLILNANFSIFKQDSTFLNTSAKANLSYPINFNNSIQLLYEFENSEIINESILNHREFKKNLFGIAYKFNSIKKTASKHSFEFESGLLYGSKKTIKRENQNKFFFEGSYAFKINEKNSFLLKNSYYQINNSNLLQNELFRIGGVNSIRGFDDESIFTKKYNLTQLQYQLYLTPNFNVFSITDFAIYQNSITQKQNKIYSFGLGINTNIQNNSILSIIYALGKPENSHVNLRNSKFHIKISYRI